MPQLNNQNQCHQIGIRASQMLCFQDMPAEGLNKLSNQSILSKAEKCSPRASDEGTIKCSIFVHANNDFVGDWGRGRSLPGFDLLIEEFSGFVERRDVMRLSLPGANH